MVDGDNLTYGDLGEFRIRYAASAQKTLINYMIQSGPNGCHRHADA